MEFLKRLWNDEEGQGLVEYGLIIALVSVILIAALTAMNGGLQNVFAKITAELNK